MGVSRNLFMQRSFLFICGIVDVMSKKVGEIAYECMN